MREEKALRGGILREHVLNLWWKMVNGVSIMKERERERERQRESKRERDRESVPAFPYPRYFRIERMEGQTFLLHGAFHRGNFFMLRYH